ncbi:MAG: SEC-C domain-containing protein [Clostridiales Family XIII bacterium]|jgi:hypothetical protein|nr:SEC-C domain-containing protein [Clostridiales Family XIII bacterium]
MSLFKQWQDLASGQTNETLKAFWDKYAATEIKIYSSILDNPGQAVEGSFGELMSRWDVEPVFFMGFLDGVTTSLNNSLDLESMDESSAVSLDIDFEKLYFNMHDAKAKHLYELPQWETVLDDETRQSIIKKYRTSKTLVKEKLPGRNDPCPCGSGKKYKKCCGAGVSD